VWPNESTNESALWLPPRRLRQYTRARLVGAALFLAIFAMWLVLQWSSATMRCVAIVLMLVTILVTWASISRDHRRARGRQVRCERDRLTITRPDATSVLLLGDVDHAVWREVDSGFELAFCDSAGRSLACLDEHYLGDQAEARAFLHWLRQRTQIRFDVKWDST
jgi:hypothetical protein